MIIFKAQLLRASLSVGLKLKNENDTFFSFVCCVLRTKMNLAFSYCINQTLPKKSNGTLYVYVICVTSI